MGMSQSTIVQDCRTPKVVFACSVWKEATHERESRLIVKLSIFTFTSCRGNSKAPQSLSLELLDELKKWILSENALRSFELAEH